MQVVLWMMIAGQPQPQSQPQSQPQLQSQPLAAFFWIYPPVI
jgi:hypothetical protein